MPDKDDPLHEDVTKRADVADAGLSPASTGDTARLADAVAGIAGIRPHAPDGFLTPRLRVPRLAACVSLAVAVHMAGFALHFLLSRSEGAGGRHAQAYGFTAIETEIIDGRDVPDPGGRVDTTAAGMPRPEQPASSEQAPSDLMPSAAALPAPDSAAPPATPEPSPPEQAPREPDQLIIDRPAETAAAQVIPAPAFPVDTAVPPIAEPAQAPAVSGRQFAILAQPQDATTATSAPAEPSPPLVAAQPSTDGEAGMAEAAVETPGNGGVPAASVGQIKTYHRRLEAHIAAHRPVSRGRVGRVTVTFVLNAEGSVQNVFVVKSTGNVELEARSLAAMRRASPFPKPPAGLKKLEFTVPFGFGF